MQQEIQRIVDRIVEQKWSDFLHAGLDLMPEDVLRLYEGFAEGVAGQVRSLEQMRMVRRVRGMVCWLSDLYSQVLCLLQDLPGHRVEGVALVAFLESRLPRREIRDLLAALELETDFNNANALYGKSESKEGGVPRPLGRAAPDGPPLERDRSVTRRRETRKARIRHGRRKEKLPGHRHRVYDL